MTEHEDPAGDRLLGLRDAVKRAGDRLESGGEVSLREIGDGVRSALDGVQVGDLGDDEDVVRGQLAAFLRRIGVLAESFPDPVRTTELDLPADARFFRDMTAYLTRRYGLEDA